MTGDTASSVVFYWRPGCPFCSALRRRLSKHGLSVHEVNIWEDDTAAARVRAVTGGDETVPTVVVGPVSMVNPHVDEVLAAVRAHAPRLLHQREKQVSDEASARRGLRGWFARLSSRRAGP
ncbi:glutaredoxin family protein [Nocardiopsis synnemataformans]|uniref:glutaredoxin family protein n=1 Tax=Nocardiopsis synnemataformans TaxID=61305 RepID=UPI003EC13AFC